MKVRADHNVTAMILLLREIQEVLEVNKKGQYISSYVKKNFFSSQTIL